MKTVRLYEPRLLKYSDEPVPEPGEGEVLLKIKSVGVCASDVHYFEEGGIGDAVVKSPLVLGHEAGAQVAAVGPGVTGIDVGARVAVEPSKPCGVCPVCKRGLINMCPHVEFFGTPPVDGAFREYVAWPAVLCIPIPDDMGFEEAAMTEPMAVGIYSVDTAKLKGGETVAVLGTGAIGLSVIQAAKMAGAGTIWAVDPITHRTELASELGADKVISGDPAKAVEAIWLESGGYGVDCVFECAGQNDAVRQGVTLAGFDTQLVVVGIPFPDEISFAASKARRKNLTVKFVRRSRHAVERAIEWASEGKISLKALVTHRFDLDGVEDALKLASEKRDGVIRSVVEM